MRILILVCWLTGVSLLSPAFAQDKSWLQIEAQPSLNTAMDRARAYSSIFPDVEGYRLKTGWYGIGLGPMTRDAAGARLLDLRRQNLIPADSYISDGKSFADRFWPVGADAATPDVAPPDAAAASAATPDTATPDVAAPAVPAVQPEPAAPPPEPEETAKQAKAAEAALPPEDRMAVQDALKWYGFYDGKVDGHIGAGTRTSMAAWQTAQTYDPTGVLTSKQRAELVGGFKSDKAEFGFEQVTEAESGIEITLPMALIGFDRYEPPFVHYTEKNGSALKVLLISEPGGASSLAGLYSILQTLELVPPNGERALKDGAFTIHGANDKIETLAYAASVDGNIKGYLLSWRVSDAARMARVLPVVQNSFRSLGDKALDPGLVPLNAATKRGLLAGLEMRKPKFSRSGFFVQSSGVVVTTVEAVASCGRVTLERNTDAKVSFSDTASGIAVLTPQKPMAPGSLALFATAAPRLALPIAVAGYPYEDRLPAPVVTLGTVDGTTGLNGESGITQLGISARVGDTGGPVIDQTGAVQGMLLPVAAKSGQTLPDGVGFAVTAAEIAAVLSAHGITPAMATNTVDATPDALAAAARGMTVLVSCWE